jgi:hypothetical protein
MASPFELDMTYNNLPCATLQACYGVESVYSSKLASMQRFVFVLGTAAADGSGDGGALADVVNDDLQPKRPGRLVAGHSFSPYLIPNVQACDILKRQ